MAAAAKGKHTQRPRPLEDSKTVGTVIGGEFIEDKPHGAKRKQAKPKAAGKRAPKKGGYPKKRGGGRA